MVAFRLNRGCRVNYYDGAIPQLMKRAMGLVAASVAVLISLAATPAEIDTAFKTFWDASNPQEATKAIDGVLQSGVAFDEAYARLKRGRTYGADVPRGVVRLSHRLALGDFWYAVEVPERYDPARSYQVRIQLHGGVLGRTDGTIRGTGSIGALAGAEQFYILPASWNEAPWWSGAQLANVRAILDTVKRMYNIDENRVTLAGVSDGGTATWYFAMRDTTPYANFASLNGAMIVLQSPGIGLDGLVFPQNLVNKPYFIVNGWRDRLYPISVVQPYVDHVMKNGVEAVYHPRPEGEHNTSWWPEEKDAFEAFVRDHPRRAIPDRLSWETDLGGGETNRAHWLVIDTLMAGQDPRPFLPDLNIFDSGIPNDPVPPLPLFRPWRPWGRVDMVREGNTVLATTRGVSEFTLLLSPEVFDFSKPVTVVADGRTVFEGRVERRLATLMKWAANDNDRTMLFGAELNVALSR
jgi:hypothetical protein